MEALRARSTLFALLSSIEDDLRKPILEFFTVRPVDQVLNSKLFEKCLSRLTATSGYTVAEEVSIRDLIIFSDLGDLTGVLNSNSELLPEDLSQYIKSQTIVIDSLVPIRNRVFHNRPLEDGDWLTVSDQAEKFNQQDKQFWSSLNSTLTELRRDPSFVLGLQVPSWATYGGNCTHNLPLPDFDETTLIGREQEVKDLIKLCHGGYPAISIIGDGGLGKTALALKVAYDILDSDPCPFDLIVWTTAKTARLGPTEIITINDAISDSMSMIEHIRAHVAGRGDQIVDPIQEIITQMKDFRILLVLDNLETVLDDYIRSFMQQLPLSGSKILITSRIGLGIENRYKLKPLAPAKAKHLFRKLCNERQLKNLLELGEKKLDDLCTRTKNSPGFIKWFVSAVQAGARPEDVLSQQSSLFLDFCMSNVYQYLSPDCHKLLKAMLCAPAARSQAELSFLLKDVNIIDLKNACQELESSNMVTMVPKSIGTSITTHYQLSDLARQYLRKHHPPTSAELKFFTTREQMRAKEAKQFQESQDQSPYIWYTISTRSSSDFIIAKYLVDAMNHAQHERLAIAEELLAKAADLDPEYYEVHRVKAIIAARQNDIFNAKESFEEAIAREPKSAPLRLWYGDFLRKKLQDPEAALLEYTVGLKLAPTDFEIVVATAKTYKELGDFESALALIKPLIQRSDIEPWKLAKALDIQLEVHLDLAKKDQPQSDSSKVLKHISDFRDAFEAAPLGVRAGDSLSRLTQFSRLVDDIKRMPEHQQNKPLFDGLSKWVRAQQDQKPVDDGNEDPDVTRTFGEVINLPSKAARNNNTPGYGFVRADCGDSAHFWSSELRYPDDWLKIQIGDRVSFLLGENAKGLYAMDLKLERIAARAGKLS